MKKRITFLMAAFMLLAFLAIPMGMRGQTRSEVTHTFSEHYSANTTLTDVAIAFDNSITGTFGKGEGSTAPQYYTNGTAVRWYGGNTLAITASNATISEIVLTYTQKNKNVTTDVGTYNHDNGTWSGSASSVTFTVESGSGHNRVSAIKVTYSASGSTPTCATPTFSPAAGTYTQAQNVTISCSTEGATIYYTTNGQDPTTNSTVYSGAINVSTNTTIKAMAAKSGYDNSAVATAEYAFVTLEHAGTLADPYTVADAHTAIDANAGTQGVYATGVVSAIPTEWSTQYNNITFNFVDAQGNADFLQAYRCASGTGVDASQVAVGDVVVVYGNLTKYGSTYEFGQGCTLVSLTHPTSTEPSITVTPATLNVDAQEHLVNYLDLAYENIDVDNSSSFTVHYYNAEGDEIQLVPGEAWMTAGVAKPNDVYQVLCTIIANEGEARTAYFKLSALDAENNTVYSNLVTVNQEAYVAPSFAELPFAFNSGRAAIEETDGLSQDGLGTDYNAETNPNTQLKFDGTGDWLLLQFDERPGTLSFDIKGNSFSGGTFTVQTSEDGETYVDLAEYTELGDVATKTFDNLGENVRYIKWIYTNKASGNVGLGNIALAKYEVPVIVPSIAITPDNFELDANSHMGEILTEITYQNIVVVPGSGTESFDVQYYDAEGQEIEQTWCTVGAVANGDTAFNLSIAAGVNEGNEARTAYFKLYGHDEEANVVYSNLVTVTQAAPVIDYAVLPFVWEGGERSAFEALNGTSTHSVGDYAETQGVYRMKLDATGDYIQVKCDQQPGKITIGVKMVGGSNTSTITIQGSADGETFTDIEVLTISGAQGDELTLETTNAFADADRYVRMLFTKGSNVGVGPITIEKGSAPSIAVTPATLDLEASGSGQDGVQMQQFVVTYHNLDIESHSDFTVQFYDAEGEEQEQPAWITPNPAYVSGGNDEGYMVMLFIEGNTDVARSAYYKVSALDADENVVYSNLVTINQAGAPQQYTLTVEPFENLELITFVNEEMIMEGDGEITVTEGDEIMLSIVALEGYEMETLMVNGVNHVDDIAEDYTYTFQMPAENVTISATAVEDVPVTPGSWVLTNLTDLTENDVFVIVGTDADDDTFALPYNGGTSAAPSATAITIVENAISGEPAAELQWNLSGNTTDGYTFYPNGETETWLYCTNTNNGVRVGTNDNKTFKMDEDGYLVNDATSRVLSIYVNNGTPQDWRCYSNYNNNPVVISFYKKVDLPANSIVIEGYGDSERGGYYLIASPFTVSPTDVQGMTEGEYDLYSFDEAEEDEWRNYKAGAFENLEPGKGYLYAHSTDVTLTFDGEAYNGDPIVLKKTAGGDFEGWNLVGNPYTGKAYIDRDFYVMNPQTGDEIITGEGNEIAAMQGFFVIADHDGEELEISTEPTEEGGKIVMNVNSNRGNIIDRAMIRFGEGRQLPKFMLNEDNTKLYIAKGEEEYAVARNEAKGEMNLNFEAAEDGTYTLDFTVENVELDQLLLIDDKTGVSIDLLCTQSYTFEATTDDAAARFRIVFGATTSVQEENINKFAFYNNGNLIINNNGNAILNIVDVLGRIISSYNINGSENVSINAKAGVYMLQLIQGDKIQTQKIVVE